MLRLVSRSVAVFALFTLLSLPAFAQEHVAAPASAPEAPKAEPAKTETPAAEPAKAEPAKTESSKSSGEKATGKMRDRWKKMTPEQREEMRKKAEGRLGERFERLKTAEQEAIKTIMTEINKLNKEQRSILMAKIRQQAHNDRVQRKAMKDMEKNKKESPAADPNAAPAATKH